MLGISEVTLASYVNSCEVVIKLLKDTSTKTIYVDLDGQAEREKSFLPIDGIVENAKPFGRADSGCKHYIGQKFNKTLINQNRRKLIKGQRIKVNILIKDFKDSVKTEQLTLLDE